MHGANSPLLSRLSLLLPERLGQRLLLRPFKQLERDHLDAWRDPAATRERALAAILRAHRRCDIGQALGFDDISGVEAYRATVAPSRAGDEAFRAALERQLAGDAEALVAGPLLALLADGEGGCYPLGGDALVSWRRHELSILRLVLSRCPRAARGDFVEILPAHVEADDPLTPLLPDAARARLGMSSSVIPSWLFTLPDDQLRFELLLRLALERRVTVLRAPTPGALVLLARTLASAGPRLLESLATGRTLVGRDLPDELARRLPRRRPARGRAEKLQAASRARGHLDPRDVWPELSALICPTGGSARAATQRLAEHYGPLPVLHPGLEHAAGLVSEPYWADLAVGALPQVQHALIELYHGDHLLGPRVEVGTRCAVLLTTHRGCYRQRLVRQVEVVGQTNRGPQISATAREPEALALRRSGPTLVERQVRGAALAAARSCGVGLVGFELALLERPARLEPERSADARDAATSAASGGGLLSRIFGRARQSKKPRVRTTPRGDATEIPRPLVCWTIEPARHLHRDGALALAAALEAELRQRSPSYAGERLARRLDRPRLVVLERGTLSSRARKRLMRAEPDGHAARPLLRRNTVAAAEEIALHVEAADDER